jgi:GTPase SAR1 family protein
LIGNKSDAPKAEGISEKAKQIAATNKAQYFEVSAKTGENVSEPFQHLASALLKKMQQDKEGGLG